MTTELLQQPPAPAAVAPDMSDAAIQLRALVNHQTMATDQLLNAQARLNSLRFQVPNMKGAERTQAENVLRAMEGDVNGLKADLDETRARIRELRSNTGTPSATPAPVAIVGPPPERIFGYTKTEFEGVVGLLVLFPIVLAASRWIWRRGSPAPRPASFEGDARFTRLEQAVESIAIEVERISESQRFATKLLAERQVEPAAERAREPSRAQRRVVTPLP
jgi:hypothetical protein